MARLFSLFSCMVLLACISLAQAADPMRDFSRADAARGFRVINDAVMGGVSTSRLSQIDGALVFEGTVSLENNGGFASFRGAVSIPAGARTLRVTMRGDGQRYKLALKAEDTNAGAQYQAGFVAPREWSTVNFTAADFAASFRGRPVEAPVLAFPDMRAVGVLIADKQSGPFRLEIRSILAE
jgi:hypothetical protein